ncbi:MAG: protein kinase, partial [Myxococcota bacterium]
MPRITVLPSPVHFGKYQLTERIANGRMAEVFKAKRDGVEGFEKILVVKRLYPHYANSEYFIDAFVEEAKLTVSLSHANIAQVLDLGQQEEDYFIAMEHVAGYDLDTIQ